MSSARPGLRTAACVAAVLVILGAGAAEAQQPAPRTAPAAKPTVAATPSPTPTPGGGGGGRESGGEPIEIQADRLVVDQDQELATFSGNVDAVQGELSLRADLLRVFYTEQGEQAQANSAGAAGGGGTAGDQGIRRIEADGSVVLRQPGETAEGDAGVYDPIAETMVLEGNVVLTRGENVVRGTRLDSNLASGVSVVTAAPGASRGQRVRALFVPEQNKASP